MFACSSIKYTGSSHSLVKLKRLLNPRLSDGAAGHLGDGDRHCLRFAHISEVLRRPLLVSGGPHFAGDEVVNVRRHKHENSGESREKKREHLLADHGIDDGVLGFLSRSPACTIVIATRKIGKKECNTGRLNI